MYKGHAKAMLHTDSFCEISNKNVMFQGKNQAFKYVFDRNWYQFTLENQQRPKKATKGQYRPRQD